MNKAVFLDRDGTINVDKNYLYKIEDFEFLPGAVEGLRLLQASGFLLIIITNQSGIARGFFTETDYHRLNDFMLNELERQGVHISRVYYCPYLEGHDRKPETGLFEKAVRDFDIELSESFAIGDKPRDCSICEKSECRGFLINCRADNLTTVSSLLEAAKIITSNETPPYV